MSIWDEFEWHTAIVNQLDDFMITDLVLIATLFVPNCEHDENYDTYGMTVFGMKQGTYSLNWSNGRPRCRIQWNNNVKHGFEQWWRDDGRSHIERAWRHGRKDGLEKVWFQNGCPWLITMWKDDKKSGAQMIHSDTGRKSGRLLHKTFFLNDLKHGLQQEWTEGGRLVSNIMWKHGKLHGLERQFDHRGRVKSTRKWKNGIPVMV